MFFKVMFHAKKDEHFSVWFTIPGCKPGSTLLVDGPGRFELIDLEEMCGRSCNEKSLKICLAAFGSRQQTVTCCR